MKDLIDAVAKVAASYIEDNQIIGLGTGSTANRFIECLGERIKNEGLSITGMPSSYQSAALAEKVGIQIVSPCCQQQLDITVDGADEVDPLLNLVKGGGGALLNEKIVASKSKRLVIVVSEEKIVPHLGARHHLPVEVIPEARFFVEGELSKLKPNRIVLRSTNGGTPFFTEHQNLLLDLFMDRIDPELEYEINMITGVVDNGLFTKFSPEVLVAKTDGVWKQQYVDGTLEEKKL